MAKTNELIAKGSPDGVSNLLATLLEAALPLARFMTSTRCSAMQRAKVQKLLGTRELDELIAALTALRGK